MVKRRAGISLIGLLLMVALVASYGTSGVQAQGTNDVSFAAGDEAVTVTEADTTVTLTVERTQNTDALTIDWTTDAGSAAAGADFTTASDQLEWESGEDGDRTIEVDVLDDSLAEGDETFDVILSHDDGDDVVATITIEDDDASNIALSKEASADTADPDDSLTYTITVTNAADTDTAAAAAGTVVITDDVPAAIEFDETDVAGDTGDVNYSCVVTDQVVECSNDADHGVGEEATITIAGTVDSDAVFGEIENTASAAVAGQDEDPSASATVSIGGDNQSNIAIDKSADVASALPGETVNYTIEVTNAAEGDAVAAPAGEVTVTDAVPAAIEFGETDVAGDSGDVNYTCTVTGQDVECTNDADHTVGATGTITIAGTVASDAVAGPIENTVSATVASQATAPADDSATVAVEVAAGTRPVHIAKQVAGEGAPELESVSGTISPGDPTEWTIDLPGHVELDVSTAEQTVTEDDPGEGWTVEYAVVTSSEGTCGTDHVSEEDWSTEPAVVPEGDGDFLVCILNTYEAPEPESQTYELSFRWTLIGWTLPDMDVADALSGEGANAGGDDISEDVTAVFGWDAPTQTWAAYFPGAGDFPGANDLETFESGQGYWIAIDEEAGVTWEVTASGDDEEE